MKVYARTKTINNITVPYNVNIASAIQGFLDMGFEVIFYKKVEDIYPLYKKGDIILDGLRQVEYCLSKFNITPKQINYPDVLKEYLGRNIWENTMNNFVSDSSKWNCFIKPQKEKIFTGKVIKEHKDLIGCVGKEDFKIWCSDIIDLVFECRGFYYYGELKDLRPYCGNWQNIKLLDTNLIQMAVLKYANSENKLNAISMDWGVTKSGKTILIECNTFSSLGSYGYQSIDYAKGISAYFSQISETNDEGYFEY